MQAAVNKISPSKRAGKCKPIGLSIYSTIPVVTTCFV